MIDKEARGDVPYINELRAIEIGRRRFLAIGAFGASVAVSGGLLAACNSAPTQSAATVRLPDPFGIAVDQQETTFDSDKGGGVYNVTDHIFDFLVMSDPQYNFIPWLATSWKNSNPTTWVFQLRKGVEFTNGEPFNAQSVKYSLDRIVDPAIQSVRAARWMAYGHYSSTEILDDYAVAVKTSAPSPIMLALLSQFEMRPPHYYSTSPESTLQYAPIGSGPYKLGEPWTPADSSVVLEANEDYWAGKPSVKQLVWKTIAEADTRIDELVTGGVQIAVDVPPDQISQAKTNSTTVDTVIGSRIMTIQLVTNDPSVPMHDVRVRQAMNYASGVAQICSTLLDGTCKPYPGPITPPYSNPSIKPYPEDLAKARQLLSAAGYPHGFTVNMDTCSGQYIDDVQVVQAVIANLARVGINVNARTWDWTTYLDRLENGPHAPMYFIGQGGFEDPYEELARVFDIRDAIYKGMGWNDDAFYKYMDEAGNTTSTEASVKSLWKAEEILWEAAPAVFLYWEPVIVGVKKGINWKPRKDEEVLLQWLLIPDLAKKVGAS